MSKQQQVSSIYTSEAEFSALGIAVREIVRVRSALDELQSAQKFATVIHQDNFGSIRWTEDLQGLRKVKHVGLRYHYLRQYVPDGSIKVAYTSADKNRDESLTKSLVKERHSVHRSYFVEFPKQISKGAVKNWKVQNFQDHYQDT